MIYFLFFLISFFSLCGMENDKICPVCNYTTSDHTHYARCQYVDTAFKTLLHEAQIGANLKSDSNDSPIFVLESFEKIPYFSQKLDLHSNFFKNYQF